MDYKVDIPQIFLFSSIFSQILVYILTTVDLIYYYTGILVVDPLRTLQINFYSEIELGEYMIISVTQVFPVILYGMTVLFYPMRSRFHHRMRWFGAAMMLFGLHIPLFAYLRYVAYHTYGGDGVMFYAYWETVTAFALLLFLIITIFFLPSETDAEREHRKLVAITGVSVGVLFLGFSFIVSVIRLFITFENLFLFFDISSAIFLAILSLLFIIIIRSTIKVYREVSLSREDQELYPDNEMTIVMKN